MSDEKCKDGPRLMKPDMVRALLKGTEDLVGREQQRTEEFFSTLTCPQCGDSVQPFVDAHRPFQANGFLNYMARCTGCGCEFSPYTRIVTKQGIPL